MVPKKPRALNCIKIVMIKIPKCVKLFNETVSAPAPVAVDTAVKRISIKGSGVVCAIGKSKSAVQIVTKVMYESRII